MSGTYDSPAATQDNRLIIEFGGGGRSQAGFSASSTAMMRIYASEDYTETNFGTRIEFYTTEIGSDLRAKSLSILDNRNLQLEAIINRYNSIDLELNGVPSIINELSSTDQAASTDYLTIYSIPASGEGYYRISFNLKVTTAATTSSSLEFNVRYTDATDSQLTVVPPNKVNNVWSINSNSINDSLSNSVIIHAKASTDIEVRVNYATSGATAAKYKYNFFIEKI